MQLPSLTMTVSGSNVLQTQRTLSLAANPVFLASCLSRDSHMLFHLEERKEFWGHSEAPEHLDDAYSHDLMIMWWDWWKLLSLTKSFSVSSMSLSPAWSLAPQDFRLPIIGVLKKNTRKYLEDKSQSIPVSQNALLFANFKKHYCKCL